MAPSDDENMPQVRGSRPVPDPTLLTTQALTQAVGSLKELFEARVTSLEKNMEMLQQGLDERSKEVREAVRHLERLHDEKFVRITTQIAERDVQRDAASRDVKAAVDSAFAAAKEAVTEQNKSNALAIGKSEATTARTLDNIAEQIRANTKNTDDKINDIKERITKIESLTEGISKNKEEIRKTETQNWGYLVGFFGIVTGLMIGIAAVITMVVKLTSGAH